MRGTVVSATAQSVQIHTPDGLLTISSNRILKIDYSDQQQEAAPTPAPAAPPAVQPGIPRIRRLPTRKRRRSWCVDVIARRPPRSRRGSEF